MMVQSKTDLFPVDAQELARACKALGHPARVLIVQTLMEQSECMCGDLVLKIPLSQATISQHLKALKEAGLIKGELSGPRSKYCLDVNRFRELFSQFSNLNSLFDETCS